MALGTFLKAANMVLILETINLLDITLFLQLAKNYQAIL